MFGKCIPIIVNTIAKMTPPFYVLLLALFSVTSARVYNYENEDGSYSIGTTSDSTGQTANSVLALLEKSSGWTDAERTSRQFSIGGIIQPNIELLKLAETFLNLKGEIASRVYAVINDNYDMIRSVYLTVMRNAGTLHKFTLQGVIVLRKLLEVLSSLFSQWQVPASMRSDGFPMELFETVQQQ